MYKINILNILGGGGGESQGSHLLNETLATDSGLHSDMVYSTS